MLQPSNRLTLVDAMRPPDGFVFDAALAVTFTLDLRALLAAPAAFVVRPRDGVTDHRSGHEPIELLHAIRAHAGKLTILSQAGEIALPPSRRVFAFLERSVVPVRAPLGGLVHPKVWVLRYRNADEERLRVLVASRNLTFDPSWDTLLRLDEADRGGAYLAPLGEMFESLLEHAVLDVELAHRERVASLAAALRSVRFALPAGVDDLRVRVLGLRRGPSPLPARADRSLVLSPFVSDDFFSALERVDELVSRPEELDRLGARTLERIGTTYAFDDGSASEVTETRERRSAADPGRPLAGLHAKVFAFEEGSRARVLVGSANATGPAFTRNVEVLVELEGDAAHLGIDRLCEGNGDEPGLRTLLIPYRPDPVEPPASDEEGRGLDTLRRAIASLRFDGVVEGDGDEWAVIYRTHAAVPAAGDARVTCWPLAAPGSRHAVTGGKVLEERFSASVETISGLLAFELEAGSGFTTEFVVPVALSGVPEQRDRLLLRALIADAGRFLRYLLTFLSDDPGQVDLSDVAQAVAAEGHGEGDGRVSLPVLEKLLRTMRRDAARLLALDPLVTDLSAEDALPPGFAELWTSLREIALEERPA